jgi:hypothetical protein
LEGCNSLKELDCAENSLKILSIESPYLHIVSCKINRLKYLLIKDCSSLKYLDFSNQGIFIANVEKNSSLRKTMTSTECYINSSSRSNLKNISFTEGAKFLNSKDEPITYQDFPKIEGFDIGSHDDPAFEEYLDKKRDKEKKERYFQPDEGYESDEEKNQEERTIPAANFKEPADKKEQTKLTLSHMRITGKLVIKD